MKRHLSRFGWWLIDCFPQPDDRAHAWRVLRERPPSLDELDAAIIHGMRACGVNAESYALDLDLGGKRYEVLHHAAKALGNELRTVEDIKALLK